MKTDIAATITAKILLRLEAGTKPWVQPWTGAPLSRPLRHCGSAYRGINTLLLWMTAEERGYSSPYWMTYRQAEILKGQVRKGEKCAHAVFYKTMSAQGCGDDDNVFVENESSDGSDNSQGKTRRLLRQFAIFNADQIEGLPEQYYPTPKAPEKIPETLRQTRLHEVFDRIPASVRHNGFKAYYNISRDEIVLPAIEQFSSYEGYFATRAHETAHWSGAKHRLDRTFGKRFGDDAYAMEELVADITAATFGAILGLPDTILDNHASYIDHWVRILKSDKNAILTAASRADVAVDYLLGFAQPGRSRIVEREPALIAA